MAMKLTTYFRILTVSTFLLLQSSVIAQFNEDLEKKILSLAEKYKLDGIEKGNALDRLEEISPSIGDAGFRSNLTGETWKYSHSVDITGRKYRRSNAVYIYQFDPNGEAYLVPRNDDTKTYCKWNDETSSLFELDHYKTSERTERTRRDYFGIIHVSEKRLVLAQVVRSKTYSGKSAILFNVYFRR